MAADKHCLSAPLLVILLLLAMSYGTVTNLQILSPHSVYETLCNCSQLISLV